MFCIDWPVGWSCIAGGGVICVLLSTLLPSFVGLA